MARARSATEKPYNLLRLVAKAKSSTRARSAGGIAWRLDQVQALIAISLRLPIFDADRERQDLSQE
jgi:hypothetical protein